MTWRQRWDQIVDALVNVEGSTRPVALLRLGIACLIWAEFGRELLLFRDLRLIVVVTGFVLLGGAVALFLGFHARLAALACFLAQLGTYYHVGPLIGRHLNRYHHLTLLVATGLLALTPCGASYAIDRFRAVRRALRLGVAPPAERGLLWGQKLIAVHLSTIYFWTALNKVTPAFLSGARMQHFLMYFYTGSDYPTLPGFAWLMASLAIGTVVLEFALCAAVWLPSLRRWLMPCGAAFHLFLYYVFPISTFSLTMILLYLSTFDPDAVHRLIDEMSGVRTSTPDTARPPPEDFAASPDKGA